jgi:hypothetical protein
MMRLPTICWLLRLIEAKGRLKFGCFDIRKLYQDYYRRLPLRYDLEKNFNTDLCPNAPLNISHSRFPLRRRGSHSQVGHITILYAEHLRCLRITIPRHPCLAYRNFV